jgi:ADP-heptose:LPS heptosyltransferase
LSVHPFQTHAAAGLLTPPCRIAVLRALKFGDLLCAVPTFRALRAAWPRAEIILIGLPWAAAFVDRFRHLLDGFREFPGYPGLPEREPLTDRLPAFFAAMRADHYDLAIQLHGSGLTTNPVVELFGAKARAGFYPPGRRCPDPRRFLPWPGHGLEVRRLLALVEFLGITPQGEHLEFTVHQDDRSRRRALPGAERLERGGYVCVHPGASVPERRWPPEHFAAVADRLTDRGLAVVLTGTAEEAGLTQAVAARMRAPALDYAGRTDLGTAGALIEGARVLVCNDTGVSHLAAALRVPSVVLSTGDNPARWAPADRRRHRVLCREAGVEPDEVFREVDRLLRETPDHGPAAAAV